MAHAYPMMLDVTDRLVVLVGGGAVAARKAAGLLAAGATRVRCVSPAFHEDMPAGVERVRAVYERDHLSGAGLVFAATNAAAVNDAVVRDARAAGVLVNRADPDDVAPGDFATPATHRDGRVTLTVSAAGSPTLAAVVRDELSAALDRRWVGLAESLSILRPMVLASGLSPTARRDAFRTLATHEAADVNAARGVNGLIAWLRERHPGF